MSDPAIRAAEQSSVEDPQRVLGGVDTTCIVIGAIVGVGIFFTPRTVAEVTGSVSIAMLAWAICGGIALCGALTFAALGLRYHGNGAQYEILRDAYGPMPAFTYVFCNATAIQSGAIAIIAIICARHLGEAVTGAPPAPSWVLAISASLILGLIGANVVGVRWGARIQNLTVYAKVLTLLAVTLVALIAAPEPEAAQAPRTIEADATPLLLVIAAGLVAAFFSFGGWQHALWISGEVRDPRRVVPRSIVLGVLIVVVVYLLANWAYFALLGFDGVVGSQALAADAIGVVSPGVGPRLIALAVAVSAFGVLNAQLLS